MSKDLTKLSKHELQDLLKSKGLSTSGSKIELMERYKMASLSQMKSPSIKSVSFDSAVKPGAPMFEVPEGPLTTFNGKPIEKLRGDVLRQILKHKGFYTSGTNDLLVERLKTNVNIPPEGQKSVKQVPVSPIAIKGTVRPENREYTDADIRKIIEKSAKGNSELFVVQFSGSEPLLDVIFRGNIYNAILGLDEYFKSKMILKGVILFLNKNSGKYRESELPDVIVDFFTKGDGVNLLKSPTTLVA